MPRQTRTLPLASTSSRCVLEQRPAELTRALPQRPTRDILFPPGRRNSLRLGTRIRGSTIQSIAHRRATASVEGSSLSNDRQFRHSHTMMRLQVSLPLRQLCGRWHRRSVAFAAALAPTFSVTFTEFAAGAFKRRLVATFRSWMHVQTFVTLVRFVPIDRALPWPSFIRHASAKVVAFAQGDLLAIGNMDTTVHHVVRTAAGIFAFCFGVGQRSTSTGWQLSPPCGMRLSDGRIIAKDVCFRSDSGQEQRGVFLELFPPPALTMLVKLFENPLPWPSWIQWMRAALLNLPVASTRSLSLKTHGLLRARAHVSLILQMPTTRTVARMITPLPLQVGVESAEIHGVKHHDQCA